MARAGAMGMPYYVGQPMQPSWPNPAPNPVMGMGAGAQPSNSPVMGAPLLGGTGAGLQAPPNIHPDFANWLLGRSTGAGTQAPPAMRPNFQQWRQNLPANATGIGQRLRDLFGSRRNGSLSYGNDVISQNDPKIGQPYLQNPPSFPGRPIPFR